MSLERATARALDAYRREKQGLVALLFECAVDVEALVAHLTPQTFGPLVLWDTRSSELDGELTVGIGSARTVEASGAGRFEDTRVAIDAVLAELGEGGARAFGGFAYEPGELGHFAPLGEARFVVPRWTLTEKSDGRVQGLLIASADELAERGRVLLEARALDLAASSKGARRGPRRRSLSLADDGATTFQRGVERAIVAIEAGAIEKVVLARVARLRNAPPANEVLPRLSGAAGCVRFGFQVERAAFVGATPEMLIAFDGKTARTEAVAGTEPRRGADLAEASRLLASDKDRREHALVVNAISAELTALGLTVVAADEPRLRTLTHLHHLVTPMLGTATRSVHVIDLVARLHPTPAMGGVPREAALRFARENEPVPRGHYASPVGWVGAGGRGAFAVGIRSALLLPDRALLFAGAGIVRGSLPDLEVSETSAKLLTMLAAVSGESGGQRRVREGELGV